MAVEAHHLRLFSTIPQLIDGSECDVVMMSGVQKQQEKRKEMRFVAPGSLLPIYNPVVAAAAVAEASESGVTFNNNLTVSNPRKRLHGESDAAAAAVALHLSAQMQQEQTEVDRLLAQHMERVREELVEKQRRTARQIAAAVEAGVARRMRAKEEEISRISRINSVLEERIRGLCVENQIWRNLAQSNEAAANVLRSNLEQVLAAYQQQQQQQQIQDEQGEVACAAAAAAVADDAESCCGGCDDNEDIMQRSGRSLCRRCARHEPSVLLLPCRHLCVCTACGPEIDACPVCNCTMNGSVNVNIF